MTAITTKANFIFHLRFLQNAININIFIAKKRLIDEVVRVKEKSNREGLVFSQKWEGA
jgi:hypothetical protein